MQTMFTPGFWADSIKWFHGLFVLFAMFGGILLVWFPALILLHAPAVIWAGGINLVGWTCPLTPLENRFRQAAGEAGYRGGFIQHYLEKAGLSGMDRRTLETRVGWTILGWNGVLYIVIFSALR
ncbi:DUF2784 domain-containing protein [Natronocella acetinitrilica]|nr:DUF2784 domain-containing protein [Natronocella acetinitrilica]